MLAKRMIPCLDVTIRQALITHIDIKGESQC